MLIRQNVPNMNDEYHHADIVGMYPVLTDASANVLRSYVFDAYAVPQSQQQFIGESYPVQSTHTGTCLKGVSEPGMSSSPNGGAVSFQARALNVTSKKSLANHTCLSTGPSVLSCLTACLALHYWPWHTCAVICLSFGLRGRCTWLILFCLRLPDGPSDMCMDLYDTICKGR